MAALLLLLVWVGPVTFAETDAWHLLRWVGAPDEVAADSRIIPAGQAAVLEPGTALTIHLRDGSMMAGRFLGRTLLDSTLYTGRFEARARSSSYEPLRLGDTLRVALRDGREWNAPFAGYGELALLLRNPDGGQPLRVPFEFATTIHRADGSRVDPRTLARAFRHRLLPSAEALAIEDHAVGTLADQWASALRVAVDDITSVSAELPSGKSRAGTVVGTVVLSVVISVVLVIWLISSSVQSASDECGRAASGVGTRTLTSVRLTTRPFDRYRACYAGDTLAADPWPDSVGKVAAPFMASALPVAATTHAGASAR